MHSIIRSVGVFCVMSIPLIGNSQVLISEVAWMGTSEGTTNEWIELYNHGATDVTVDGWTLSDGESLQIILQGVIAGRSIIVLERTDDATVPAVTAFQIYTGALGNDGRTLTLRDAQGVLMDQAVGGENWSGIGGNNDTKETPQRTMTGWITGVPTPGAENVAHDTGTQDEQETITTNQSNTDSHTAKARSPGGKSSSKSNSSGTAEATTGILSLAAQAPKTAYVNQEVSFEAIPAGIGSTLMHSLAYTWNFGDTYTATSRKTSHVFAYPGEYVVVVEARYAKHRAYVRHEITVLPVSFTVTRSPEGNVLIRNNATHEVDLGGFTLSGEIPFVFPHFTILKAGNTLTIPSHRINTATLVSLHDTQNMYVTGYNTYSQKDIKPKAQVDKNIGTTPSTISKSGNSVIESSSNNIADSTKDTSRTVIHIGSNNEEKRNENIAMRFIRKIVKTLGL